MSILRLSAAHAARTTVPNPTPLFTTRKSTVKAYWPKPEIFLRCNAILGPHTAQDVELGLRLVKWEEAILENDEEVIQEQDIDKVTSLVEKVSSILRSIDDGDISASPYDTAYVAMLEDTRDGQRRPQFPSCLDWISRNQLGDGSWGDRDIFSIYDRILNTLACVIALTTWNVHSNKCNKGIEFIKDNIKKWENEREEQMPIGFEVAFPSLLQKARLLNIAIPHDSLGLRRIYAKRDLKLTRIPLDVMHSVPTTLLHSLEGLPLEGLNWEKLLKLQSSDGSFLFSPSSTAFVLRHTNNSWCLDYLANIVRRFHGGVPNVYPVDMFERIWAVDRLQRLGISRYFYTEIDECLHYVNKYWTDEGICWARNSEVQDIDDTSMGFRLLRLQGYTVSSGVFKQFERKGEFVCFAGQSTQAVTGMYNLYRAAQVMFPGEEILTAAATFSGNFLREKRARNELVDKWIITKDLPGEVGYALEVPWHANLPRLEARLFLEQYGGDDDVWIGKTLYRMPHVNNTAYLELAKLDYNYCQSLHQQEWNNILKWYEEWAVGLGDELLGTNERSVLLGYYTSAACMFEPERRMPRVAWAKTAILVDAISSNIHLQDQKRAFVDEFLTGATQRYRMKGGLMGTLLRTLKQLALDALLTHGRDVRHELNQAWVKWLNTWAKGERGDAELFVRTINVTGGWVADEAHPKYQHLMDATTYVFHHIQQLKGLEMNWAGKEITSEIEIGMQKLVELVFTKTSDDLGLQVKQNFLMVAKSLYYTAYFSPDTIDFHIARVLFERVV